jgi:hypothetical protein
MLMIRNTMFALSLLALTTGSAFAATKQVTKARTIAAAPAAPAADTAAPAPAGDEKAAPAKKEKKAKVKKEAAPAGDKATKEAPKGEMAPKIEAPKAETK